MRKLLPLLAAAALLAAPAAPSAHAQSSAGITQVFVAYGTGITSCKITLKKRTGQDLATFAIGTEFSGTTDCTAPVDQTGRATIPAFGSIPALDGGLCSGFRAVCTSGGNLAERMNENPLTYRVSLRAPTGQGWLGAPTHCSGVGTDNLQCEFTANDVALPVAVVNPRPLLFPPD